MDFMFNGMLQMHAQGLTRRPPVLYGASSDYVLDYTIASQPAQAMLSETGIVRSVVVDRNIISNHKVNDRTIPTIFTDRQKILELQAYRDSYVLNDERYGLARTTKGLLAEIYRHPRTQATFPGMNVDKAAVMIEDFWRRQLHANMILPDAHLDWRVLLPMASGCLRTCTGCPERENFTMLDKATIERKYAELSDAMYQTHSADKLPSQGFFDIADLAFLFKNGKNVKFNDIMDNIKTYFPSVQNDLGAFFGTPIATALNNKDENLLREMCQPLKYVWVGVEAIPPINQIVFHKNDAYEQIMALPGILKSHNPNLKVIAIVQAGYAGEGVRIGHNNYMAASEIASETARMVRDAGFDGARISEHVELDGTHADPHIANLKASGVISGKTAPGSVGRLVREFEQLDMSDIDYKYNRTIKELDRDRASGLARRGIGIAASFKDREFLQIVKVEADATVVDKPSMANLATLYRMHVLKE